MTADLDDALVRDLVPQVIGVLVRRGADFAAAEDAVQAALLAALATWPAGPPRDPKAWLITAAWRKFLDGTRSDAARAARQVRVHAEAAGLLALMLLHHARRPARTRPDGALVPLAVQDRSLWDTRLVAEGVTILQSALARDRLGEYQAQAAIAALHCDARSTAETDWVQVVEWYDELVALTDSPVHRLNRAVAVGEADGARAGLAALGQLDPELPRHTAVAAHLHEKDGDLSRAAALYAEAARRATNVPERAHLTREAARVRQSL